MRNALMAASPMTPPALIASWNRVGDPRSRDGETSFAERLRIRYDEEVASQEYGLKADKPAVPLLKLSGRFFRAVLADRIPLALAPPDAASAGRYHRLDQPALYMSPSSEWAKIAVSGYMREDHRRWVILPLLVSDARVFDQRDEEACRVLGIDREMSNQPWRPVLASGGDPASWCNADAARAVGADGIVDRSRMILSGWHVNLFRWNDLGGPSVESCGDAIPICFSDTGEK